MNSYDSLHGGSRARLARYRRNLERSLITIRARRTPEQAEEFISSNGYTSALNHRYSWLGDAHGPNIGEHGASLPASVLEGLRAGPFCKHGYYRDTFQDETYTGRVWLLPHGLFLAGYVEDGSGYAVLEVDGGKIALYDNEREALRAADELARVNAERDYEYNERWQEASNANDERDEARKQANEIRAEWRALAIALLCKDLSQRARQSLQNMTNKQRAKHSSLVRNMARCSERIAELGMEGEF